MKNSIIVALTVILSIVTPVITPKIIKIAQRELWIHKNRHERTRAGNELLWAIAHSK